MLKLDGIEVLVARPEPQGGAAEGFEGVEVGVHRDARVVEEGARVGPDGGEEGDAAEGDEGLGEEVGDGVLEGVAVGDYDDEGHFDG